MRRGRAWTTAIIAIGALANAGCVERRMTVRTNPANALVVLDGQEIGFTPVSVPFTYYGCRQIKLVKDGYETTVINQNVSAPWYQYIGFDFISEVLLPWRIRDERDYNFDMRPRMMVPQEQVLLRANEVRAAAQNPPERALRRAKVDANDLPPPAPLVPAAAQDQ